MHNKLQAIIARKHIEVDALKAKLMMEPKGLLARYMQGEQAAKKNKSLHQVLSTSRAVIAEIKRHSPANGMLSAIADPVALAQRYQHAGAAAISVLTDEQFFKGSVHDLEQVSAALAQSPCAILRKDFIVDKIQIAEAVVHGADAILLIVAVLQEKTQALLTEAKSFGLDVLLEVHTEEELALALDTDARIIGVNNRNLSTFHVDLNTSLKLVQKMPHGIVKVAESGIHDAKSAHLLFDAGFDAILVGEALVKADSPAVLINAMRDR